MNLKLQSRTLTGAGFEIMEKGEAFRPIRFFDVGALVWFAKIIEWEFPGFSVDGCLDRLFAAQDLLESHGSVDGTIHRYMMAARKKRPVESETVISAHRCLAARETNAMAMHINRAGR